MKIKILKKHDYKLGYYGIPYYDIEIKYKNKVKIFKVDCNSWLYNQQECKNYIKFKWELS